MTPTLHRKWAREFLDRADAAYRPTMKRRYLRLAVNNTVCALRLEATISWPVKEGQS
ncbi:MAG: hypothetical protein AB7P12_16125 [Alphaproteobacteria bacterium]